jgi:protein SCO1/2
MPTDAPSSTTATPRASGRVLALVGAALVAAGAGAVLAGRVLGRGPEPPRMSALPDFRLTERSGRPLSLADLSGRPWVADFIFTQCGGACPAMTARMARLRREVPAVAFVSFTVDPAHDTPETLTRYAAAFHADESWHFLTGPQKDLYDLSVGGFKLAAMEVPPAEQAAGGDGPFLHSSKFVLVDAEGVIRGYYDSTDEQAMRTLVADAEAIRVAR